MWLMEFRLRGGGGRKNPCWKRDTKCERAMSGSFHVPMGVTWKGEQYTQKGTRGCGLAQPFEEDGDLGDREEAAT